MKTIKLFRNIVILLFVLLAIVISCIKRPTLALGESLYSDVQVSAKLLKQHVKMLSVDFAPRDYTHIENLNGAAGYITKQFEAMGYQVDKQSYNIPGKPTEFHNLEVKVSAANDSDCSDEIVIGAHYDSAGELPGADDNASGVAGLIELGRLLKKESVCGVTLVAYTLEEPPFFASRNMGSYVHAKSMVDAKRSVKFMLSLEMIGYFTDEKGSQEYPLPKLGLIYPDTGNFIAVVDKGVSSLGASVKKQMAREMDLPVHSINAPSSLQGIDFSDHRNYWAFGFDAAMITDTAFYRNKAYHTADDTYDRLSYDKMAEVVKGVYAVVMQSRE